MLTEEKSNSCLFAGNNANNHSPRRRNLGFSANSLREEKIKNLLLKYDNCINSIKNLKKVNIALLSKKELYAHNRDLDLAIKKKKVLSDKLLAEGYKVEKRGRPKKDTSQKYKTTHTRIGCYFTKLNASYLKQLKESGLIDDISTFLNNLIDEYKEGVNDEK